MAKKIVWSAKAQINRKEILEYWLERNRSNMYSIQLDQLFREAVQIISQYPAIGRPTEFENVRGKLVRDYYIFYQVQEDELHILSIWDSRQNPDELRQTLDG